MISEIKSGKVTLRRTKHNTTKSNPILQDMFKVLEQTRRQNRNSKIILDTQLSPIFGAASNFNGNNF